MKDRHKGILIALFGVLCISPDAVLVRFLTTGGTDPFVIVFWKLLFSVLVSAGYALYETRGIYNFWQTIVEAKYYFLVAIPVQTAVDICFLFAFVFTSAANALLLINLNPLWCAVLGRLFLGDALPLHTIVALVLALGCMAVIFIPDIVLRNQESDEDNQQQNDEESNVSDTSHSSLALYSPVKGNIISFATGILFAIYISIMRKGGSKGYNLVGVASLAALLGAAIALIAQRGDVLPNSYWRGEGGELWQFWLAIFAQGMGLGTVFAALTVAPRLAKGAEIGLVLLLEVLLGPLWVFFAYGDVPPLWTLIGGSILLVILALHESIPLFEMAHREIKQYSSRFSTKELSQKDSKEDEGSNHDDAPIVPPEVEATV